MKNITSSAVALILFVIASFVSGAAFAPVTVAAATTSAVVADYPVWIAAPSIKLSSPIQGVGVNSKGEMAVPSGRTNNVGWYENGVVPGSRGTAVLDAHVFAAFKSLSELAPGATFTIYMASGAAHHYVVTKAKTYALSKLSSSTLFSPTFAKQVNLITCAGKLTADRSTYDHRLIVSAEEV